MRRGKEELEIGKTFNTISLPNKKYQNLTFLRKDCLVRFGSYCYRGADDLFEQNCALEIQAGSEFDMHLIAVNARIVQR